MRKKIEIIEDYQSMFKEDMLMFYRGPFNKKILAGIGSYIKETLKDDPDISYKLFSIFIELAQNIYFHSDDLPEILQSQKSKYGTLMIQEWENRLEISAGNFIKSDSIYPITEQCHYINSLNRDQLREYKKERRKLEPGIHGEANIGLIQVALQSANPIALEIDKIDESFSFITITTILNKSNQIN